jgi:hypothetical protein
VVQLRVLLSCVLYSSFKVLYLAPQSLNGLVLLLILHFLGLDFVLKRKNLLVQLLLLFLENFLDPLELLFINFSWVSFLLFIELGDILSHFLMTLGQVFVLCLPSAKFLLKFLDVFLFVSEDIP